jgi:hypothetical protein
MPTVSVNMMAVLVSTIAAMAIGAVWYSPLLFINRWMKEIGLDPNDKVAMEKGKKDMVKSMVGQLIASFITAFVLGQMLSYTGVTTAGVGAIFAAWIWVGFYATAGAAHVFFERKSWTWFAINTGCSLVTMLVMGAILGVWR